MKSSALIALCALATGGAGGQSDFDACEVSQELTSFYLKVKVSHARVKMLEERLASDPENLFLNRWYLESPQIRIGGTATNTGRS